MASTFHGGITFRLPQSDRRQADLPKESLILTYRVDESTLNAGDKVVGGELLGKLKRNPVRAPLSGQVTALSKEDSGFVITLKTDGKMSRAVAIPFGKRSGRRLADAERDELLAEIEASGIVEQSGEALIDHLERAICYEGKLRLAAVCCFDLDPLCQTNVSIITESAREVAGGLTILLRLLKVKEGTILCDRRFKESVSAAEEACADSSLIAIEQIANRYPQANPRLITRWLMEKELSAAREPEDAGLFLTDAETCASLYRFFAEGIAEPFKRLTFFADGELTICDLPYGLSLSALEALGLLPAIAEDESLCRGAMDGRCLPDFVDATLNSLAILPSGAADVRALFPEADEASEKDGRLKASIDSKQSLLATDDSVVSCKGGECISCGRCVEVCPMFLLPYDYLQKSRLQLLISGSPRDAGACIGCGCCSYICPAGLPLRSAVLSAARKEHRNEK